MSFGRCLLFGLVLLSTSAPPALAKDVCIEIANGVFPGSIYVLKDVKLGARKSGPVHGYWAKFEVGFQQFAPVQGQAIVSSTRTLIVGLALHNITINADASGQVFAGIFGVNLRCTPGADGKLGVADACVGNENGGSPAGVPVTGQLVECKSAPGVP